MKRLTLAMALGLLLAGCAQKENTAALTTSLDSLFATVPDFSGVLLVAEKGKPVYHKSFGYRDFETKAPMDTTSIFELASVSKQFTSMTIMMLKEEKKLNYDDAIDKYIPGLPYPGITIRHLLNHTSGLPDYQAVMDKNWDKTKVAGNADNIEYLIRFHPPVHFAPGEKYEYSNTGYMLLASIAEKASGHDFIAFCKTRIFVPVEMTSTDIRTREDKAKLPNMTSGHIFVAEKQRYIKADSFPAFNYSIWLGNRKGPGRVSSTTTDLLKWDQALNAGKLVEPFTFEEADMPAKLNDGSVSNYGFGWELQKHPVLGRVMRHSGSNPGYQTHIIRYIDANKTVIFLCNNEHEKYVDLLEAVEKKM